MPSHFACLLRLGFVIASSFCVGCGEKSAAISPTENVHKKSVVRFNIDTPYVEPNSVRATAWYQTLNSYECMRTDYSRGGSKRIGIKSVPLLVQRTSKSVRSTTAYTDEFVSKKYFPELPVCVWTLTSVNFSISTGGMTANAFSPSGGTEFKNVTYSLRCGRLVFDRSRVACKIQNFSSLDPSSEFLVRISIKPE
jgi:hypothetical protein